MKPVELNLSTTPFRNDTPLWGGLIVLAALTIGLTAFNTYSFLTADETEKQLRNELASHDTAMTGMSSEAETLREDLDGLDLQTLRFQAEFAESVLKERNFSWTALFNELEEAVEWNVRLSSVRPSFDGTDIVVNLVGTAQSSEAFFAFQEMLEKRPYFSDVLPSSYRENQANPEYVEFQLTFDYAATARAEEASDVQNASNASAPERLVVDDEAPSGRRAESSNSSGSSSGDGDSTTPDNAASTTPSAPSRSTQGSATQTPTNSRSNSTANSGGSPAGRNNATSGSDAGNANSSLSGGQMVGGARAGGGATRGAAAQDAPAARRNGQRNLGSSTAGSAGANAAAGNQPGVREQGKKAPTRTTEVEYDEQGKPTIKPRLVPGMPLPQSPDDNRGEATREPAGEEGGESEGEGGGESESGGGGL